MALGRLPSVMAHPSRQRARVVAWIVILAAVAVQGYARRHGMTPDGVAYLDLSDAVVNGRWAELLNGYWSPLYAVLIGVARVALRPSPYWEFATVHLVNVALFVLTIPAFEWFLTGLVDHARGWRRSALHSRWGIVGAYVVFGTLGLTMTPVELPTPDLIIASVVFIVFGASLRLLDGVAPTKNAFVIGVALAIGVLAKSFFVPWSLLYLAVMALATVRRFGVRPIGCAAGAWMLLTLPWCVALSARLGHPTFGDTGRLTYAWFVNNQEPPALGGLPSAAETPESRAILRGVAITGDAPGTNPVWLDPVRFDGGLHPTFDAHDQIETMRVLAIYYLKNLSPLIFAVLLALSVAPSGGRALAWRRGWTVFVPVLATLAAYGAVLVTTRYIEPFLVAGLTVLGAGLPWPRRIAPRQALVGVLAPLGLLALRSESLPMLALLNAVVAAMMLAYLLRELPLAIRAALILLAAILTRVLLTPTLPTVARVGGALLAIGLWQLARRAQTNGDALRFARLIGMSAAASIGFLIVGRAALRLYGDVVAVVGARPGLANPSWTIAHRLGAFGMTPGSRIALLGSPYEAYWARAGRLRIVAAVPAPIAPKFWQLPLEGRQALIEKFRASGATYALSLYSPVGDSGWTPTGMGSWIRALR